MSLDAIELKQDHIDISRLGWSLRFNKSAPSDEDKPLPAPGGNNPQYIAPEYFGNATGAWDGFEIAVRAVLGQQITVKAATTLAGRLAQKFDGVEVWASNEESDPLTWI